MKKMMTFAAAALISISAFAQTSTTTTGTTNQTPPTIQQRKANQQARIAQGVKSGQLTAGETAKLEKKEAGINKEERGMRQANGGKLTQTDRKAINQQQNTVSRQIYKDKHNNATQPGVTPAAPGK